MKKHIKIIIVSLIVICITTAITLFYHFKENNTIEAPKKAKLVDNVSNDVWGDIL